MSAKKRSLVRMQCGRGASFNNIITLGNMRANGVWTAAAWRRRTNLHGASADVYACSVKCR